MAGFKIETKLRPAYYTEPMCTPTKVLFHCWSQESNIIRTSLSGGHPGGIVSGIMGIVETENGRVMKIRPEHIRFVPGEFDAYIWDDEEAMTNNDKDRT